MAKSIYLNDFNLMDSPPIEKMTHMIILLYLNDQGEELRFAPESEEQRRAKWQERIRKRGAEKGISDKLDEESGYQDVDVQEMIDEFEDTDDDYLENELLGCLPKSTYGEECSGIVERLGDGNSIVFPRDKSQFPRVFRHLKRINSQIREKICLEANHDGSEYKIPVDINIYERFIPLFSRKEIVLGKPAKLEKAANYQLIFSGKGETYEMVSPPAHLMPEIFHLIRDMSYLAKVESGEEKGFFMFKFKRIDYQIPVTISMNEEHQKKEFVLGKPRRLEEVVDQLVVS